MEGFESIAKAGVHHFETLFQENENHHLPEIMKIIGHFPTSISDEENEDLMIPVTLVEFQSVLNKIERVWVRMGYMWRYIRLSLMF